MSKKATILTFMLGCLSCSVLSQDTTFTVQFAIIPQDVSIRIDGKELSSKVAALAPGTYLLEAWHPLYEYWVDTLVVANKPMVYRKRLDDLAAYTDYRADLESWYQEKKKMTKAGRIMSYSGLGLMGASGGIILPDYLSARSTRSDLQNINESIAASVADEQTQNLTDQFNALTDEYDTTRSRMRILGFGVFLPATVLFVSSQFVIKGKKKKIREKPSFEPNAPFTRQDLQQPSFKLESNGFSTSLKFNF